MYEHFLCFLLERPIKIEPMDEYEPPIPRIDKFDRPIKLEPVESKSSQIKIEVKNPSESKSKSSKSSSPHKSHHKHHSSSSSSSKEVKDSNGSSERRKESKHHSNEKRDKSTSSGQPEKSHTSSKRKHNDSPIDSKEATSDDDRGATASKYQKIDSQSSRSSKSSHKDKERHRHSDSSKHSEKPKGEREKESSSSSSKKHHSSKESSSTSSPTKKEHHKKSSKSKRPAVVEEEDEQIDNSEGMGFAEALAMFDMPSTSRKKDTSSLADKPIRLSVPAKKPHSDSREASTLMVKKTLKVLQSQPSMLQERSRLDPLPDITPLLIPEYKPMPLNSVVKDYLYSSLAGNGKPPRPEKTDKELEFESFSSKANRTKVFSGNKQQQRSDIPTLYEMCIRILQENIDFLETTGGVPFDILRPVLERAKADQLANIEYYNPYLLEESDVLWEPHCKRKFRTKKRQENEAWREMYEVSNLLINLSEIVIYLLLLF